ncbi:25S rRNA (adenine645-N1)-methyltransferase [Tulasnella sp. 330]|nr:25S rRNA (adenine645-N1)-methyltransferase [Tulasnella sp. 330]
MTLSSSPQAKRMLERQPSSILNGLLDAMDIDSSQSQNKEGPGSNSYTATGSGREAGGPRKRKAKKERTSSISSMAAEGEKPEVHERRKRPKKDPTPEPVIGAWAGLSTPAMHLEPLPNLLARMDSAPTTMKAEERKKKKGKAASSPDTIEVEPAENAAQVLTLTPMQQTMKEKLQGGRFRYINETLYKSGSHAAHKMIMENPKTFEEYHIGFRRQVTSWPTNPVEHYISNLSSYAKSILIVDLGCGDASLAKVLIPKGYRVVSFDLVSDGEFVTEADICDKLPLPGAVNGGGRIVDVVVGELKIAEVTSRFTDVDAFVSVVSDLGFQLLHKVHPTTHFTLFEFKAAEPPSSPPSKKEWQAILKSSQRLLKPCEYKRR